MFNWLIALQIIIVSNILSITITYTYLYFKDKKNKYKVEKENETLIKGTLQQIAFQNKMINYENDIVCLLNIIEHKIKLFNKSYLEPLQASNERIKVSDADFKQYYENIITETMEMISEDYKKVLLKYFSEEGLYNFIVELIFTQLTNICVKLNLNNFKNTKEIFQYNMEKK